MGRGEHGIVKVLLAAGVAVALVVVGVLLARAQEWGPFEEADPQTRNVFAERAQYVDPLNRTRRAADQLRADGRADDADLLMRMAAVPSGIWLTPEQFPRGSVGEYVADLVATTWRGSGVTLAATVVASTSAPTSCASWHADTAPTNTSLALSIVTFDFSVSFAAAATKSMVA